MRERDASKIGTEKELEAFILIRTPSSGVKTNVLWRPSMKDFQYPLKIGRRE